MNKKMAQQAAQQKGFARPAPTNRPGTKPAPTGGTKLPPKRMPSPSGNKTAAVSPAVRPNVVKSFLDKYKAGMR